jgi:acylphosphatase
MTSRATIIVRGIVQSVGFRIYTRREAQRLGLGGYVRNQADGSVEIVAEGSNAAVDRLVAWAKHGPPAAVVDNVEVTAGDPTGEYTDFTIRH